MLGWKVGLELFVYIKKKSRRGVLVAKKGTKWHFRPYGYRTPVSVCPVRFKWRYAFKEKVVAWPSKLSVILVKSTLKPFKYKQERVGHWRGAACERTVIHRLPVWQVVGTNKLYVGHLGVWRLVGFDAGSICPKNNVPKDGHFFVGRGPLTPKRFRCLKTACGERVPVCMSYTKHPIYKVPTRAELG
ncbi:hypothetical protein N9A45_01755 [bacterium]|nr:hypothetical protein [bacterium]